MDYTIKAGDTLSGIAAANKTDVATLAKINNISDPNKIQAGASLRLSAGPTTSEVPGIGTLTITPKGISTAPVKDTSGVGDNAAGLYARTGVTPPELPGAPSAPTVAAAIPGLPTYPSGVDTAGSVAGITKAYKDTLEAITALESRISGAAAASPEEQALQQKLAEKRAQLGTFDVASLQTSEDLTGQGRGISTSTIARQDQKIARTRALERLGLAQEADTLTTQLGLAQEARKGQGDIATSLYNLATKKLDISLGLETKINTLNEKEKNNARQYLLDVVNFSDGKTYDQLDDATRTAITSAVANSPITLDMVKTALTSSAEKAAASARGDLRSVAGVGVVMINPDGTYKVVVPESPSPTPTPKDVPTFEEYLAAQNLPIPSLVPATVARVRAEYDSRYGTPDVNLGKLTATNKAELSQAGLSTAPTAVQSYYLNTPATFRDQYNRDVAAGKVQGSGTLDAMVKAYTAWYDTTKKKSGSRDWSALIPAQ